MVEAGNCDHPGPTARRLADFFGGRYDAQVADEPDDGPPPGVAALGFLVSGYDDAGVRSSGDLVRGSPWLGPRRSARRGSGDGRWR